MKRLVAMLLMITFAWGVVVTASHAATPCNDLSRAGVSSVTNSSTDTQKADALLAHHCAVACHVSVALPASLWSDILSLTLNESPEFFVAVSIGHTRAVPTPPPSLT